MFLVQLNPTGTIHIVRYVSGRHEGDLAARIVLDRQATFMSPDRPTRRAWETLAAAYGQYNYPTTASAYQPVVIGGSSYSAFVTELAPNGQSLLYSTMFSAPNQNTYNNALAVGAGKIFIGGYTQDPHLPTTPGAISSTCVGGPTAPAPIPSVSMAARTAMSPSSIRPNRAQHRWSSPPT